MSQHIKTGHLRYYHSKFVDLLPEITMKLELVSFLRIRFRRGIIVEEVERLLFRTLR